MTPIERQLREQIRDRLNASGVAPECVGEIVDLAMHAATVSVGRVLEICDTGSAPDVRVTALGPAYSVLLYLTQTKLEMLQELARSTGLQTFTATVELHP